MSWNNNNYGRRGGGGFEPAPRPVLSEEHTLLPIAEAAIKDKADLKRFSMRGPNPITQTVVLQSDPGRKNVIIAQACMMAHYQCGIHPENQAYPPLGKFDTQFEDNRHYIVYEGPIPWIHDSNWRHIPGWTRYVINKDGTVLNAYNGKEIEANNWGLMELVPDSAGNKLKKVMKSELMRMAFVPLPENFRDYGNRMYSHKWEVNPETGKEEWIALPKVKVQQMEMEFLNIREFVACAIEKFKQKQAWNDYTWQGTLNGQVVNNDGLTVKESNPKPEKMPIPVVNVETGQAPAAGNSPQPQEQQPAPQSQPAENNFDEDFSF